ncbi:hypothetical protein PR003_g6990 [Phytophthora rubi]|uniref:Alpha/beta hydrolase fold-3 domain-containing protein n=1 Tax=Phytophthora rubi TaxID=129364 RepID=A0A6A4FV70_9STRA|nr:hypothetical protein PR003_g6990 [Phytophthora rubi]
MTLIASGIAIAVAVMLATMFPVLWDSVLLFTRIIVAVSTTFVQFIARGCAAKFPNWSLRFELLHSVIRVCTETYGERMATERHAQWIRAQSDVLGSLLGWFSCRRFNRSLDVVHFNELEHVWLRNKQPRPKRLVVLYLHGGGFSVLSPRLYTSLGAELAATIERDLKQRSGRDLNVDVMLGLLRQTATRWYCFPSVRSPFNESILRRTLLEAASRLQPRLSSILHLQNVLVLLGNYRKSPEFSFPTQPQDTVALYQDYLL